MICIISLYLYATHSRFYRHITTYLSQPDVRATLGVDTTKAIPSNFTSCSDAVGLQFFNSRDALHDSTLYITGLLEHGVDVLIYVGTYDWICNWVGNERWTLALEWSGQAEFTSQKLREWVVDGKTAGKTRSAKGLTFATVDGAGHMVIIRRRHLFLAMSHSIDF